MKKRSEIFFMLFILLFLPAQCLALEAVHFVGGAPFTSYQPKVIVPLLTEAFARNGIRFTAEHLPSARSLVMSNSGWADGELHRVSDLHRITGGRYPNLLRIESPLLRIYLSVFSNRKDLAIGNWKDLSGFTVAYQRGRKNVEEQLRRQLPKKRLMAVKNDKTAFRMLGRKRVDLVVSESRDGIRIIESDAAFAGIAEIVKLDETRIYTYIHRKHEAIAPKIAETLEAMKGDGTFQKIMDAADKEP